MTLIFNDTLKAILKNAANTLWMNANNLLRYLLDAPSLRWGSSFVLVVSTYASIVWFALSWAPTPVMTDTKPMAAMMIDFAPMPVAPETPPNAVAPGPAQEETPPPPPEPLPEPEPDAEPLPELPTIEEAEAVLPPEPEPIEEEPEPIIEEQVAQQDSAPPAFEAPPDDIAAAPMEGAVSLAPSQAPATWQSVLLGHLENHKRYPRKARRNKQEAVVYVHITINRDGTVVDYRLTEPCAYKALNQETLALIARAQPLPPPPPDIKGDTVEFVVPVEFFLRK